MSLYQKGLDAQLKLFDIYKGNEDLNYANELYWLSIFVKYMSNLKIVKTPLKHANEKEKQLSWMKHYHIKNSVNLCRYTINNRLTSIS